MTERSAETNQRIFGVQENYVEVFDVEGNNNSEIYSPVKDAATNSEELAAGFIESDKETDDFILDLVLSLYGTPNLTIKHCQDVVAMLKKVSERTVEVCLKRIENCSTVKDVKRLLKQFPAMDFADYLSQSKFTAKITEINLFRPPSKFFLDCEIVEDSSGSMGSLKNEGVIMDIEFQITQFLECQGVLDAILTNQSNLMNLPQGKYRNFVNGEAWRKICSEYKGKTVLPVFLYNDDFQVGILFINLNICSNHTY